MGIGPAIYLGQSGASGRSTGPHAHFELIDRKTGKKISLSQARTDVGQYIQFRLPGSQDWQQLYSQTKPGQFALNPNATLTSGRGMRQNPVTGQMAEHGGEDYSLPQGTDLRFMGSGAVEGIANYGAAGNIGRLKTGDNRYQLDVFHLNKIPETASVGSNQVPEAPVLPGQQANSNEQNTEKLLEALFGKQESLKDILISKALETAMQRRSISPLDDLPTLENQVFTPQQALSLFT